MERATGFEPATFCLEATFRRFETPHHNALFRVRTRKVYNQSQHESTPNDRVNRYDHGTLLLAHNRRKRAPAVADLGPPDGQQRSALVVDLQLN